MGFFETNLWVEKYRPKNINQVVLEDQTYNSIKKCLDSKTLVNYLFYGPPGSGKTTIARILIENILGDKDNSLFLNGSEQRTMDILRNLITNFLSTPPFGLDKYKVVFIDEADGLTSQVHDALRNFIENRTQIGRFIFTCNYIGKIPKPIQSRFEKHEFKPMSDEQITKLCQYIMGNENIAYNPDDAMKIINQFKPDIRTILQNLQKYSSTGSLKLPSMNELIPVESNLSSLTVNAFKLYLNNKNNPIYVSYIEQIQQLIMKKGIDYPGVFMKIFEDQELPMICKVLTNRYCNSLNGTISESMHFMAYIYETIDMLKLL